MLSGVYKLAATRTNGVLKPKIKVSASIEKTTLPGIKQTYRLYTPGTHEAFADVIALADEKLEAPLAVVNSNPLLTSKRIVLKAFDAAPLSAPVPLNQPAPSDVFAIQRHAKAKLSELPIETQRLVNPDTYTVYLTQKLANLQQQLVDEAKKD